MDDTCQGRRAPILTDVAAFLLLVSHPSQIVWTAIFPLKTVNRDYRPAQPESCPEELATWVEHGLFDQLVCAQQQRLRNRQPEGLRGFQVDDQLELGGLLDREVGGAGAL